MYAVSCSHHHANKQGEDSVLLDNDVDTSNIFVSNDDFEGKIDTNISNDSDAESGIPSQKELMEIKNLIADKLSGLKNNPLQQNVYGYGLTQDAVEVYLTINTQYWREEFKKTISDSPHIRFSGPSAPTPIAELVDSISRPSTVRLQPDRTSFPADSEYATFTLTNEDERDITFGVPYIVAYMDSHGNWYELPLSGIWNDMGIQLKQTGKYIIKAHLNPRLNKNKPGTYRLYKQIRFDDDKDKVWLMTEFRLD